MDKNEIQKTENLFLQNVSEILESARKNAKTAVNLAMVYAYYEVGRMIVEEEQHGENRAAYGKKILQELSDYLTENFGKGFSVGNLKNIRQFYKVYSADQIGETVFSQFENLPAVDTGRKFYLSWSHYLKLMRIENIEERHFYEIESVKNDWSLSELKRQDIGQMQMYVNYYDRKVKLEDENPTIGILLCKEKNNAVVEMTLPEDNSQIFASKYNTVLPSKEKLQKLLEEQLSEEDGGEQV